MYLDIYKEARTNADFRDKLYKHTSEIARLERLKGRDPRATSIIDQHVVEIYRLCKYNAGFLVPYFFPQYPFTKPLSLSARPYSYAMFHFQIGGYICIRASRQIGKEQPVDCKVLTPDGWLPIGDISPGDWVFDGDGLPTKVIKTHPQGVKPSYKLTFTDSSTTRCGEDHLWVCKTNGARHWKTRSLKEIRSLKGGDDPTSDQGVRIPLAKPIQFRENTHIIHPYVLGVLLGDGSIATGNLKITSADEQLLLKIKKLQPNIELKKVAKYVYNICTGYNSPFVGELKRLNVRKTSEQKFIPQEYLYDSVENRIELLRGLMDTDGSIYGKCQMEFYSSSKQLSEDVKFLVQSLGGTAEVKIKETYYIKDNTTIPCKPCYRLKIRLWDINPFSLDRKASRFYKIKYNANRILDRIEYAGEFESICIEVDSPNCTYITEDCIVTHNSTSFGGRQLIHSNILPKYTSMYVAPHQSFLDTYANRLLDMQRAFRFQASHPDYRQNLKYKEYPNGSKIWLVKCLTDTQEARSKTTDELLYDEYQLLDIELEADIEQTQKASRMPSTIYAGTSTTIESPLEVRYQASSQGVWLVRADGYESRSVGKNWINCGDENDIIKCLSPKGFINPTTSQLLDVTNGHWVHRDNRRLEAGFVGFHIPQVIIPSYVNEQDKWRELIEQYDKYSIKKFVQEVLGIPTEEGQREITLKELKSMCVEEWSKESRLEYARSGKYYAVVSGCDWGGSDYNPAENTKVSYTVHVILGIHPDGYYDILHMRQYSGMDYRDIIHSICRDHAAFGGVGIATDFGVGAAYNMLLREHPDIIPEKHLIFAYSSPNTRPLSQPNKGGWFNQYSLNRTESITALFTAIKNKKIRCYNWAQAQDRLMEFLNLFRIPTETPGGQQTFRYQRHGAKADDTLHAVNFAHVLCEIMNNKQYVEDAALKRRFDDMFGISSMEVPDPIMSVEGGVISG